MREKYVEKYFLCRFLVDHTTNQVVKKKKIYFTNIFYVISLLLGIYAYSTCDSLRFDEIKRFTLTDFYLGTQYPVYARDYSMCDKNNVT